MQKMKIDNINKLGAQRPGATSQQLAAVEQQLQPARLPDTLTQLLKLSDGFLTPGGISVYGTEDLGERNATYELPEFCPGYLLIGDNSGGKGFLMKLDSAESTVFSSGLGDLEVAGFVVESASLETWVDGLR